MWFFIDTIDEIIEGHLSLSDYRIWHESNTIQFNVNILLILDMKKIGYRFCYEFFILFKNSRYFITRNAFFSYSCWTNLAVYRYLTLQYLTIWHYMSAATPPQIFSNSWRRSGSTGSEKSFKILGTAFNLYKLNDLAIDPDGNSTPFTSSLKGKDILNISYNNLKIKYQYG